MAIKSLIPKDQRYLGNPLLKRSGVKHNYTREEVEEYRKCKRSVKYFTEKHFKIVHVDKGLITYKPRNYQRKMLRMIHKNRFNIIMACRQSGKTTSMTAYLLWYILFNSDKIVGILANKGATAREILGRIQLAYQHLPGFLQQGVEDFNKGYIHLENGSKVYAESTASDSIRGYSFSFIYIDECAHIPKHVWDEFYNSVYPTITSGKETKMVLVSTPKGLNHFYKFWVDSKEKRNSFKNFSVIWDDVPGRDKKWKEETIANTSEAQFAQEQSCLDYNTLVTVKDKESQEIYTLPIGELYEWLNY